MERYQRRILSLIRKDRPISDAEFNRLALETYRFQKSNNPVYGAYLKAFHPGPGKTSSATVLHEPGSWREIPALPVSAFKYHRVAAFPVREAKRTFLTSGTTRGAVRGRHAYRTMALYDATVRTLFKKYVLPDLSRNARMPTAFLIAPAAERPESSLGYMGDRVRRWFGSGKAFYALDSGGLRREALTRWLAERVQRKKPVLIFSTTFALADYLDFLASQNARLRLPPGSRVLETGGYKGRRTHIARPELVRRVTDRLGIPARLVLNEYGMTELTSQFYDRLFSERGLGTTRSKRSATLRGESVKGIPPWTRILIVHPVTGRPVAPGRRGLIRILDLANQDSCLAVQTEDEGRLVGGGFIILGRKKGADLRGCSLTFEDIRR